jgi:hypothetical protein
MEMISEFKFPVASPLGKGLLYSLNWRLVGLQSRTVGFGEGNIFCVFVAQLFVLQQIYTHSSYSVDLF